MVVKRMLALPLLENQLLQVLIGEDAYVLYCLCGVELLIVSSVLLVLQGLLRRHLVILVHDLPLFLLALGRTRPLVYTCRHE